MRLLHKMFSRLGFSLGGYQACLKYGCKEYCGGSPTETMMFANGGNDMYELEKWIVVGKPVDEAKMCSECNHLLVDDKGMLRCKMYDMAIIEDENEKNCEDSIR